MWQLVFASRHHLIPQQQEEEQQDAKRVSDGYGRSFGSGPWQKKKNQLSEDLLRTFPGFSQEFLRTLSELSQDFLRNFA